MSFKFEVGDYVTFVNQHSHRSYGIIIGQFYIHGSPHYNINHTKANCKSSPLGISRHVPEGCIDWHKCKRFSGSPSVSTSDLDDAFKRAMQGI